MTDETLDFLKGWTAKHDADLIGLREAVKALAVEVAALGQQVGGLTTAFSARKGEIEQIRARLDRIERRLELAD